MTATSGQVARSTAWIAYSNILQNGIGLVSTVVLARLLTPEDFGLVALAAVSLAVIETMLEVPVGKALISIAKLKNAHFNTSFTISIIRGLLIFILMALGSLLVANIYRESRVIPIMIIIGLTSIITSMGNPKFILFEKMLDYSWEVKINVFSRLVATCIGIASAFAFRTYWALIVASLVYGPLRTALGYYAHPYWPKLSLEKWREIFDFTSWATLSGILNSLSLRADSYIVGYYTSTAFLGSYEVGSNLADKITGGILNPLYRPLMPTFSSYKANASELASVYLKSLQTIILVSLPVGFGTAYVAPLLVPLALGDGWGAAILPLQILSVSAAFFAIGSPAKSLAEATKNTKLIFIRELFHSSIKITALLFSASLFGINGVFFSLLLMSLIHTAISFSFAVRLVKTGYVAQVLCGWRTIISILFMITVLYFSELLTAEASAVTTLAFQVILGGASYSISHLVFWFLAGKPRGAEQLIIKTILSAKRKFT